MNKILLSIAIVLICANTFAGVFATSGYRWRNDNGNEKTATWSAAAHTGTQISNFNPIRLRIGYYNTNEDININLSVTHVLRNKSAADADYKVLTSDPNTTDAFIITSSKYVTNGQPTTSQIFSNDFIPGKVVTQAGTGGMILKHGQSTEIEWCIKPTKHVKQGTAYYFIGLDVLGPFEPAPLSTSADIHGAPADTVASYTARPSGNKINVNFITALNNHDHFILQESSDNINFYSVDTIPGGIGTNFKAELPISGVTSYEGTRYYRFVLYDANNKATIDRSKKFTFKAYVDIKTFQVTSNNGYSPVKIDIITQSEHFHHHGAIYRSYGDKYDRNSYKYVGTIFSKGFTHNMPSTYRYWDTEIIVLKDTYVHYVFVWWEGGMEKRSPIRSVLVKSNYLSHSAPTDVTFNIYPNPATSGKVSFDLKAYKGKALTATLTTLYGKQLTKQTFNVNTTEHYTLDVATSPGTYILNIAAEGINKSGKVLLQ
ncbi:hypothetical protein DJ568_06920 [Mucilaginibacter hurinus]|uniref:Secretion system C-terminal sorting domain-containing protein n=1 Tax=Mucilaginibacter hurinus TaxID=2201324 RepID=A0A367GS18_9SPHI|nr:T9SS type A sorting domain-containing protein [Mucilaginibacter hurinus]RCH55616.1 hypothetical protein DJ568_06920 [Mucilaginibacter hurinus]